MNSDTHIVEVLPSVDYWRQLDMFDPNSFHEDVHIIGVGATGSSIALYLAKFGVQRMHAYDFDAVEPHNLPNSLVFGRSDIGKPKVEALRERLLRDCGVEVVPHNEKVDGTHPVSGIVFLCTDTMSSRKAIWEGVIKYKLPVKLMVETRLGAEFGWVHTVRPLSPTDVKGFEDSMFSDEEGEGSPCTYRAIATTVGLIAGIASHKLIKFAKNEEIKPVVRVEEGEHHSSADMFCIRPIVATAADWGT